MKNSYFCYYDYRYITGPYPGGGGRGGRTTPTPPPTPLHLTTACHLHIVFTSTNLDFYILECKNWHHIQSNVLKKIGGACPQTLLGRHCADGARHPPPPPPSQLTSPSPSPLLGQPWVRTCIIYDQYCCRRLFKTPVRSLVTQDNTANLRRF